VPVIDVETEGITEHGQHGISFGQPLSATLLPRNRP
jgi:hypothetical protein